MQIESKGSSKYAILFYNQQLPNNWFNHKFVKCNFTRINFDSGKTIIHLPNQVMIEDGQTKGDRHNAELMNEETL